MTAKILAPEIEKYAGVLYQKNSSVNRGKMILNYYNKYIVQFHVLSRNTAQWIPNCNPGQFTILGDLVNDS